MKTKNKTLALLEIAIVLCSVFLVATLPGVTADQTVQKASASTSVITTASEDDSHPLGIYGNANEDDTIDMRDTTYIKLVIFGKKPKTDFADANYDGKVSMLDVGQTKLIILGKERELTIIDLGDENRPPRVVTLLKPVKRIIATYITHADVLRLLDAKDMIVGVNKHITDRPNYFPEISKLPSIGGPWKGNFDYEAILSLEPDIVMQYGGWSEEYEEKLPGVTFIHLKLCYPQHLIREIKELGYIVDREGASDEYIDWYNSWKNEIMERIGGLSEDEKPRILGGTYNLGGEGMYKPYSMGHHFEMMVPMAGGRNIAVEEGIPNYATVDPEWLIIQNPDIILIHDLPSIFGGYKNNDPSDLKAAREHFMNRPEFANIKAVKKGDVYVIHIREVGCYSGPAHIIGTAYMAKWFHPDLCKDIDPQAIHQELVDRFCRIDFDVREHGVFVYPPLE